MKIKYAFISKKKNKLSWLSIKSFCDIYFSFASLFYLYNILSYYLAKWMAARAGRQISDKRAAARIKPGRGYKGQVRASPRISSMYFELH